MRRRWHRLHAWLGPNPRRPHLRQRLAAMAGAYLGILSVLWVSGQLLDQQGNAWVVASMGASALLLFAAPEGELSQPWPLLGGQLVSALAGVVSVQLVADPWLAAPLAVALAIGAMQSLHCFHPPGGATALAAVLGGPSVQALGFGYLFAPVLINVLTLLATAQLIRLGLSRTRPRQEAADSAEG